MASLPPQHPAAQQRASAPAEASSSPHHDALRSGSFSAQSVDSQTTTPVAEEPQATRAAHDDEDAEPRRCWICFNDETDDDETSSEWRSPCTCSLVAHESCLLDWIADMEAPNNRRRAGASKIQCPQCKSEIRMARPRSYVVDAVRLAERVTDTLLLPGFALVTGTALYSTLTLAGTHTIYQIFGTRDALRILAPLYETPDTQIASPVLRLAAHFSQHWRLDIGLPLIPTVLIASRTTWSDSVLPFLPLIFFASSERSGDAMMQLQWPPSAAFSFAALPYLRGFYNAFYQRVCLPQEQQWLTEIQPRARTEDAADGQPEANHDHGPHNHDHDPDDEHEVVDDIEIEVGFDEIFGNWNVGGADANHEHEQDHVAQARPLNAPPLNDGEVPVLIEVEVRDAAPAPNVGQQPRRQRVRDEGHFDSLTNSLADTILGALVFPSIAAAMGELLKHTLPSSWVKVPPGPSSMSWLGGWVSMGGKVDGGGRPTSLLQTKWGRSLVGGCLFVGLKDAVLLYVRWKMAQNHRRRRILDCDENRRKAARGGGAAR
ncbi:hypothetical protein ACEQ8H_008839 [Pleosporales sp. CAS-2024a]